MKDNKGYEIYRTREQAEAARRDQIMKAWRPAACENYFTFEGKQYIYCYNSITHGHCYYCKNDDLYYRDYATRELL